MRVRRANQIDIPLLVAINQQVQNRHADAFPTRFRRDVPSEVVTQAFAAMMEEPSSFWLVAVEDRPIAFLSAEFRQREESWCLRAHQICYLSAIVVVPEFRRRGIACKLLDVLKQEVRSRCIDAIDLDVWTFNAEAKESFARLGFGTLMERMTFDVTKPSDSKTI